MPPAFASNRNIDGVRSIAITMSIVFGYNTISNWSKFFIILNNALKIALLNYSLLTFARFPLIVLILLENGGTLSRDYHLSIQKNALLSCLESRLSVPSHRVEFPVQ